MKTCKFILFLFSVVVTTSLSAQEFAPIGTEWHYSEGFAYSGDINFLMIKSVKDTVIKGKDGKQLDCDGLCWNPSGNQYIHYSNDSLFHFNSALDTFQLISDFNSTKGDSWDILSKDWDGSIDTVTVTVDSTSTILINGSSLRQLYVTYNLKDYDSKEEVQNYKYPSRIIERIGDIHYFFNFPLNAGLICDVNYSQGLRCYEDPFIGFYSTGIADSCTYTFHRTGVENENLKLELEIYPNPATDWMDIKCDLKTGYKVTLFNELGEVQLIEYKNGDSRIDLSTIDKGIYILQISSKDKILGVRKLIKN